jgi:hypothetical protein
MSRCRAERPRGAGRAAAGAAADGDPAHRLRQLRPAGLRTWPRSTTCSSPSTTNAWTKPSTARSWPFRTAAGACRVAPAPHGRVASGARRRAHGAGAGSRRRTHRGRRRLRHPACERQDLAGARTPAHLATACSSIRASSCVHRSHHRAARHDRRTARPHQPRRPAAPARRQPAARQPHLHAPTFPPAPKSKNGATGSHGRVMGSRKSNASPATSAILSCAPSEHPSSPARHIRRRCNSWLGRMR